MTTNGAAQIFGRAIRVTRLSALGVPVVGATSRYTSNAFTTISWEDQYSDGEKIEQKNAAGEVCLSYQAADSFTGTTISLTLCSPDPELDEILAGGDLLVDEDDATIGLQAPAIGGDATPNGIGLEVWTNRIVDGGLAADAPYAWWSFGRVKFRRGGGRAGSTTAMAPEFTGVASLNTNFGRGPLYNWPITGGIARVWQWVATDTLPTTALGYQAVATPPGP
jgi:hypothetical protein